MLHLVQSCVETCFLFNYLHNGGHVFTRLSVGWLVEFCGGFCKKNNWMDVSET